ncbi:MAG TPA: SpoIIE family protein phosphatase [Polyangia bacterium]|nr:SpoIIE family protein phosphatase [Polyangia bacterium]
MIDAAEDVAPLSWGWAGRGLEATSGDLHVVVPFPGGALVALLDGLGHGPEAAAACQAAVPMLEACAADPVTSIVERCHEATRRTRGLVMSLASIDASAGSLTWVGVGNVEGVVLRAPGGDRRDEAIAARPGVVGGQLPPLRATTLIFAPGDTLVLATDGIRGGFTTGLPRALPPQELAESILARFAKGTDDAHVVVARLDGGRP